jgi:transposase
VPPRPHQRHKHRTHLRKRRIKAVIPEKDQAANRGKRGRRGGRPGAHDTDLYRDRNTVERAINKLKTWRGIATRCDKIPKATSPESTSTPRRSGSPASYDPLITTKNRPERA